MMTPVKVTRRNPLSVFAVEGEGVLRRDIHCYRRPGRGHGDSVESHAREPALCGARLKATGHGGVISIAIGGRNGAMGTP